MKAWKVWITPAQSRIVEADDWGQDGYLLVFWKSKGASDIVETPATEREMVHTFSIYGIVGFEPIEGKKDRYSVSIDGVDIAGTN